MFEAQRGKMTMERFVKSRLFTFFVYFFLITLILYMLLLIKPILVSIFSFLKAVLAPFLLALIISYVLNPIVNVLERRKVPRTVAVLLIYTVFITSLTVIFMNVSPVFIRQLKEMDEYLPELTKKAQSIIDRIYDNESLPEAVRIGIYDSLQEIEDTVSGWISHFVQSIGEKLNLLLIAVIVPFLAFYMMKDYKLIERTVLALVPQRYRKMSVRLVMNIDEALGNYIRGQILVCGLVGICAYLGYWIIGLPYPLLLASLVALFNIIPYLGPFLGAAPALFVASTISLKMLIYVAVVNIVIQVLEGNVIGPQVVSRTLHLHPLTIILALIAGGELAGVLGLILAVPFVAVMKVISLYFFDMYRRRAS